MTIEVVAWVTFDEAVDEADARDCILDHFGGMRETPSRAEYLAMMGDDRAPYIEAIWRSFDATPDRDPPTGVDHQESMCPVFSDGKSAATCRAWGDLCAVWWNERHPKDRVNYCKFAW